MPEEPLTFQEQRAQLGQILGLPEPVPPEVMQAAIESDTYANNLLMCRREPELLNYLLTHPPRLAMTHSNAELVAKGGRALLKWARAGFTVVDEATFARRTAGCDACPDLIRPQGRVIYRLAGVAADDRNICRRCGCVASRKARLTTESCPAPHPAKPGLNRWEEPIPDQEHN